MARSQWHYLALLQQLLSRWYTNYDEQHQRYLDLYATMIDPSQEAKKTVQVQHVMSRWFDVVPFASHELLWEASEYGKQLYQILIAMMMGNEYDQQALAQMDAVAQWSHDNGLSLFIVKDAQFAEQALYRLDSLLRIIRQLHSNPIPEESAQYQSIVELITEKKYNFWFWTMRNSLRDGILVAISSGVLGWMGSYLRNWSAGSSSVMAAGPSLLNPTLTESEDILLSHDELVLHLQSHMSIDEIDQLMQAVDRGGQATLWDTMVVQFGDQKGNIYTNHFMDAWWRISDDQMTSKLFHLALDEDFPTQLTDKYWHDMHSFLHRIYDYENLTHYSTLLDQPWLSQTLTALSDGSMTIGDFAQLSQEQREIVTQAMFYRLDQSQLQELFQAQGASGTEMSDQVTEVHMDEVANDSISPLVPEQDQVIHTGNEA